MEERKEFVVSDLSGLSVPAKFLLERLKYHRIALFIGDLGSGKTSFIKVICALLNSQDEITSPSYSLINEYRYSAGSIYHMDFYRLQSLDEILETGIEDYLYSGSICFIEWPELIIPILEDTFITVQISVEGEKRKISISSGK